MASSEHFSISCNNPCSCSLKFKSYQASKLEKDYKKSRIKGGILFVHQPSATGPTYLLLVQSRGRLWGFPKGSREKDESIVHCALRELAEETGIRREPENIICSLATRGHSTYFVIFEKGTLPRTHLNDLNDSSGVGWITLDCLSTLINCNVVRLTSDCYSILNQFVKEPAFPETIRTLAGRRRTEIKMLHAAEIQFKSKSTP